MIFLAGAAAGALAAAAALTWRRRERRRTLGRFFSFAAHEVNTPITAINMTVLNLASGVFGEVPKEQLQWLELTREQLGRLNATVGELRDFIHLEFQRDLAVRLEECDPAEAAEAAVKSIAVGCKHAGVALSSEIEPDLPGVRCDADRLGRTLVSLAFHARKFRVSGGLLIGAKRAGDFVEFRVEFTGTKTTAAEAARSLELFYPARPRQDHSMAATGLGLGLPAELARRFGGELALDVEPGGGAVLRLKVPSSPGKLIR